MMVKKSSPGFAIFAVVLSLAIVSLLSASVVRSYLANTRSASIEFQQIKVDHVFDAGLRLAALSLASPRAEVAASAIPMRRLNYSFNDAELSVNIQNEAGFVSIFNADKALLESVLSASGVQSQELLRLSNQLNTFKTQSLDTGSGSKANFRNLRAVLENSSISIKNLQGLISVYNDQRGIHPELAPPKVLAVVPGLSRAQRERVLEQREKQSKTLISRPVNNGHFSQSVSAYYRITIQVRLQEQAYSKMFIIKMINREGDLFETVATL